MQPYPGTFYWEVSGNGYGDLLKDIEPLVERAEAERAVFALSDTPNVTAAEAEAGLVRYANMQASRLMAYSHIFVGAHVTAKKMKMTECETVSEGLR